jgi:uncharacterized protein with HEPN domain
MQQREVRVYLLDALAASEQIVSIRDEVGAKRLREDRIVRAAVEWIRIVAVVEGDIDALVRDLQTRAH